MHSSVMGYSPLQLHWLERRGQLQKEFEDKSNFIANNPFFCNWAPKYKKQLAMALEKDVIAYDGVMTKQGEPLAAIYFILKSVQIFCR